VGHRLGEHANRPLAPLLQLPALPVIAFPPSRPRDKLPPITRYAGRRPLAWIDDALPPEAHAWAAGRRTPTLLVSIGPPKDSPARSSTGPCNGQETKRPNNQPQT
jgi:hypothetical protein